MASMQPTSVAPSLIEERIATPLSIPQAPFRDHRSSTVSNLGSNISGWRVIGSSPDPQESLDPLTHQSSIQYDKDGLPLGNHVRKPITLSRLGLRRRLILAVLGGLLIVVSVVLGVVFAVVRPHSHKAASQPRPSVPSSSPTHIPGGEVIYGGDGTVVTTEQGTQFVYHNLFGGYFVFDPNNPHNDNARPQNWTPPLNQSWDWSKDQIMGVNLGGWLVLEPFITPALYQKYATAVDEWTLSTAIAADTANGGLSQLEEHYKTFITEEDFAQIAGAGLNWVRLPIPYWAIDTWAGEPFLARTCWTYALKAFDWARKYGLRVALDLHVAPGSQNGYNHGGQVGKTNLLNGVMGIANAQRLLHYLRIFTEFISQPQYRNVIVMFGIINEPTGMAWESLSYLYVEAHRMIRNITGVGEGNGPFLSVQSSPELPIFTGADRIAVDVHPYFAFDGSGSLDVVPYINRTCETFNGLLTNLQSSFGVTTAGEFSLGFNDCGLMLHSPADEHMTAGCSLWDRWENYTPTMKENLMSFAMASMDALHQWFFWTWKVGPSAVDNMPRAPLWSYKLGLDNGWIPRNPRDANGYCSKLGTPVASFTGTYLPYQTGGPGAGMIDPSIVARYGQWPPTSISLFPDATLLPTYTPTGPVPTLPTQTYPSPTYTLPPDFNGGNGWYDVQDTAPGMTTVAGCTYPNAWDAIGLAAPSAKCTGT